MEEQETPEQSGLAVRLRELRLQAGNPSVREISARTRSVSHSTVHQALHGDRLPKWSTVAAIVTALFGNPDEFRDLWMAAATSNTSSTPPIQPPLPPPPEAALLGRRVRVTLNHGRDVIARGTLLSVSTMGEIVLQSDDGDVHWCWPRLSVTEEPE